MKNIIKFAIVLPVVLASCSKALEKSEAEAGFTDTGAVLPELRISENVVCTPMEGTAEVELTISGLGSADGMEVGVLSCTDESFISTSFMQVENPANGTVKATAKITANKTWYIMAYASSSTGTAYSNIVSVDVPDIPFYAKIAGTYTGTVTSLAYGDEYENTISIILDEGNPEGKCYVGNIEPYYYANDYSIDEGFNYIEAEIDNEQGCIILRNGSSMHLGGRSYVGLDSGDLSGEEADGILYFNESEDALIRPYAFYTVTSGGEPEDAYGGAIYKKN